MTKRFIGGLAVSLFAMSTTSVGAGFSPASVRALGMGGSSIASTHGVDASYWNPAAYGFFGQDNASAEAKSVDNNGMTDKDFGLDLPNVTAGLSVFGPIEANRLKLQALSNPSSLSTGGQLSNQQIQDVAKIINGISSLDTAPMGADAFVDATAGVRVSNYGIGVHNAFDANIGISIDNTNVGFGNVFTSIGGGVSVSALTTPAYFTAAQESSMVSSLTNSGLNVGEANAVVIAYDAALSQDSTAVGQQQQNVDAMNTIANASGTDIANNATALSTRGVNISEVGFTYGYAINDGLSVGGVIKYMKADIIAADAKIFAQNNGISINKDSVESSSDFGLDLGVMYRLPSWQFGLTVRNLNTPSFKHSGAGTFSGKPYTYELKPQAKVGAAWIPSDTVTVELGYDLTKNEGAVPSSQSQYWNIGAEWDAFNVVALRLGAFQNTAQTDIGLVPTLGLGINLWAVRIDVAAARSTKKIDYDGNSVPAYLAAGLALSADF